MTIWWWISDCTSSGLFQYSDILNLTRGPKQSENYQHTLASLSIPSVEIFGGVDLTILQYMPPNQRHSGLAPTWVSVLSGLAPSPDYRKRVGKFTNLVYQNSK
ncbi:hypothetical protein AVEN_141128-1 [Araneus ventricosus]|uniref:Uncharacterized protein n=1 Tax=Araneus ventricosus TaxID=182803 RepID=A0A4Y2K9Z6_ARAVE|nr:hypothetical protein AVEN_141128-1 [Araneus ventricosus]